jgi:hypothetical protein
MKRAIAAPKRRHSAVSSDDVDARYSMGSPPEAIMNATTDDDTDDDNDEASVSGIEADELAALTGLFTAQQLRVAKELLRLHRSLRGPQAGLEAAGNFNRPPFPSRGMTKTSLGDSK